MGKFDFFILVNILYFVAVYTNGMNDDWVSILYLSLMYVLFILVSLYELGRTETEKEENENRNHWK
jgi:hypothetical protein